MLHHVKVRYTLKSDSIAHNAFIMIKGDPMPETVGAWFWNHKDRKRMDTLFIIENAAGIELNEKIL